MRSCPDGSYQWPVGKWQLMTRFNFVLGTHVAALFAASTLAAAPPACDPDNGGITLPPGFCALVAADNLGAARHIAVAPNGDVYVALQTAGRGEGGGVVALRDTKG